MARRTLFAVVAALLAASEPSMFVEAKPRWLERVGDALNRAKGKNGVKKEDGGEEVAGDCDNAAIMGDAGAQAKTETDDEEAGSDDGSGADGGGGALSAPPEAAEVAAAPRPTFSRDAGPHAAALDFVVHPGIDGLHVDDAAHAKITASLMGEDDEVEVKEREPHPPAVAAAMAVHDDDHGHYEAALNWHSATK